MTKQMRTRFGEPNTCPPEFGLELPLGQIPSLVPNKCFSILSKKRFYTNSISQNSVNEMETPFSGVPKQLPTKPAFSLFPQVHSASARGRCRLVHGPLGSRQASAWEDRSERRKPPLPSSGRSAPWQGGDALLPRLGLCHLRNHCSPSSWMGRSWHWRGFLTMCFDRPWGKFWGT